MSSEVYKEHPEVPHGFGDHEIVRATYDPTNNLIWLYFKCHLKLSIVPERETVSDEYLDSLIEKYARVFGTRDEQAVYIFPGRPENDII